VVVGKKRERALEHVDSEVVKVPDPWSCLPRIVNVRHMWEVGNVKMQDASETVETRAL
jgi:hypothetical protein